MKVHAKSSPKWYFGFPRDRPRTRPRDNHAALSKADDLERHRHRDQGRTRYSWRRPSDQPCPAARDGVGARERLEDRDVHGQGRDRKARRRGGGSDSTGGVKAGGWNRRPGIVVPLPRRPCHTQHLTTDGHRAQVNRDQISNSVTLPVLSDLRPQRQPRSMSGDAVDAMHRCDLPATVGPRRGSPPPGSPFPAPDGGLFSCPVSPLRSLRAPQTRRPRV